MKPIRSKRGQSHICSYCAEHIDAKMGIVCTVCAVNPSDNPWFHSGKCSGKTTGWVTACKSCIEFMHPPEPTSKATYDVKKLKNIMQVNAILLLIVAYSFFFHSTLISRKPFSLKAVVVGVGLASEEMDETDTVLAYVEPN